MEKSERMCLHQMKNACLKLCSYVTQCTLEFAYLAGYPLFGDVWSPACSLA